MRLVGLVGEAEQRAVGEWQLAAVDRAQGAIEVQAAEQFGGLVR